ncbi:hypothetical protein MA16_Dca020941 [Dendrobium catenatum]|uniref:Uncharacterized protein n=1 Tax=Dendrobium catenatum TaxID=906689 RepID=A0A2I0XFV3_9ASPA|nr:hypothetical protein MA16_Dca020941 [Dendrobium catenatum]
MESIVLAVTRGGSFSGSAVETNMSTLGRSDFSVGFVEVSISNLSLMTDRSVARFTGARSHENAN